MKNSRLLVISLLLILTTALSACAGGAGVANSWPGLTVMGSTAFLAYGQHVYALNLGTSGSAQPTETWRFPVKAQANTTFYAPPGAGEGDLLVAGTFNKHVFALDSTSGQERWEFIQAANNFVAQPVVTADAIYAPSIDQNLYALDRAGNIKWKFGAEHGLWGTPVLDGDILYVTSMDHHVYALNAADGSQIWKSEDLNGALAGTPTLDTEAGLLYAGTFGSEMVAIDLKTGEARNRFKADGWLWDGPALSDGKLFFGDLKGNFYAVDAASFAQVWKITPPQEGSVSIPSRPLVTADGIYFTGESGTLFKVNPADGSVLWNKQLGARAKLFGSPVLAGDSILVAPVGAEALLYAFDASGAQRWTFQPGKDAPNATP